MSQNMKIWKNIVQGLFLVLIFVTLAVFVRVYFSGKFTSVEAFQEYMKTFGLFAPAVLIIFQAVQVVFPIMPGFFGCAVGAVMFGPFGGFFCNYIGISIGSIVAFLLAQKFGVDIVLLMFPKKHYDKWRTRIGNSSSYSTFLFLATLVPLFPDDFLCYFSGLVKMNYKKFIWIILLGKPWCILAYSIIFGLL